MLTYIGMSDNMESMESGIIATREIQRRYRQLIDKVKRTKMPLYLGTRAQSEAVILDVETFEQMSRQSSQRTRTWEETEKILKDIRKSGLQKTNLTSFIHKDRRTHGV